MGKANSQTQDPSTSPNDSAIDDPAVVSAQIRDVAERMGAMESAVSSFMEGVTSQIDILVRSRDVRKSYDAADMELGGHGTAEFADTAAASLIHTDANMRTDISSAAFRSKVDEMAFLSQMVAVRVSRPQVENAMPFVDISVNNRTWRFGGPKEEDWNREYIIPRFVLLQIYQLRPYVYGNEEYTKHDGTRAVRHPRTAHRKLSVMVTHDPAGQRGADWSAKQQAMVS